MALFNRKIKKTLKEMNAGTFLSLRNSIEHTRGGFAKTPVTNVLFGTEVDYDKVRRLYYNNEINLSNGAFFAKPIVNGLADHVGLPQVTMQDENTDNLVNGWIADRWQKQFWEMYRTAFRDSKCWVRLRKPLPGPFVAESERNDVTLEILDGDNVTGYYDPFTHQLLRIEVATEVYIEDATFDAAFVPAQGARVYGRVHNIIEIITAKEYLYYDQTLGEFIDNAQVNNDWGFIPFVEVFNDYDSTLHGGSSVLENAYPFFKAFHDVSVQTRQSHEYHADPKVKFKLDDVMNFLRNNFPESFTDDKFNGQISWKGKDVYFMESTEDVGFIEAQLNTGDSVTLMEFLVDCICMASEVTEAVLFRAKSANAGETDELFRFKKRIERSRNGFAEYIQQIVKMALVISTGQVNRLPSISWLPMQITDVVAEGTAMNQIITAAEVANRAGAISLATYRAKIRPFFPQMKDDAAEAAAAQAEAAAEQQKQLGYEKQLAAINPPKNTNGGQNGLAALNRIKLPIDVIHPSAGN